MRSGATPDGAAAKTGISRDHVPRADEGLGADLARSQTLVAQLHERIDVELIIREDHEVLEMLRIRAGVVIEPAQRIIDARRAEQGQRFGRTGRELQGVIGDRVVNRSQVRHIEMIAQGSRNARLAAGRGRGLNVDIPTIGEMNRDRLVQLADFHRDAVIFNQPPDLVGEISSEQIRPRHRGLIHAGACDKAVGETRIEPHMGRGRNTCKRIVGADPRRQRLVIEIRLKMIPQEFGIALVYLFQTGDCGSGVGERLGDNRWWC